MILIIMGAAGSGKSTIAQALSESLGWPYFDADSFHNSASIEKMTRGIALTDEDRAPWLEAMQAAIISWRSEKRNVILACSALKKQYRELLCVDESLVHFVYLKGSKQLLTQRLAERQGHFMKVSMLESQLANLEEPEPDKAYIVDAGLSVVEIVSLIKQAVLKV